MPFDKIAYDAEYRQRKSKEIAAYKAAWRLKNAERIKQKNAEWYKNNKERALTNAKAHVLRDPQREIERKRAYRKRKPHVVNARTAAYKAQKRRAMPSWANKFFIGEAYALAKLRGKVCGGQWEVDHIVPVKSKLVCGLHTEGNLQVIPASENRKKLNVYWPGMP